MPPSNSPRPYDGGMRANAAPMKLWDGHKRAATEWSGLHRETELWSPNGNCLVYLYGKGECDAGPSFRVDLAALIRTGCYGFIERYIDKQGKNFRLPKTDADWNRLCSKRIVSLYVPAVPGSTRSDIIRQHLSIRNFLAWVIGLPLVGAHLGGEIVTLFQSMAIYRPLDTDSAADLLVYLEFAGYLNMVTQPDNALAAIYVAEFLRDRDLYTRAFVHCVGMGDNLYQSTEYMKTSLVSRKLLRTASQDLKIKLNGAAEDLGSFLDEELSESRIGLPLGVRAHLDKFRSALLAFYTTKFGYFPPADFDVNVVRVMLEDFEALYDVLVDDGVGTLGMFGGNNDSGLCTLQIIRAFDSRNSFDSRQHPLPLLPAAPEVRKTRRMSWLGRGEMGKPSSRLVAHAALIKATNWREGSVKNDLVRMYRDFEGKSLEPSAKKGAKADCVSITDARKVRWILVYSMCQVLGSISRHAPQVVGEQAPYFLSASVAELPPWSTARNVAIDLPISTDALPTMPLPANEPWRPRFADGLEIKPDIDYFALTHNTERQQSDKLGRGQSMPVAQAAVPSTGLSPAKSGAVLSRRSTIRNSIRRLRPRTSSSTTAATSPPSKSTYHEIVVEGYGNGTNQVKLERRNTVGCGNCAPGGWPSTIFPGDSRLLEMHSAVIESELPSTQSHSGSHRSSNVSSLGTMDSQAASDPATPASVAMPEFEQNTIEPAIVRVSSRRSLNQRYPMRSVLGTISRASSKHRGSLASTAGRESPPMPQQHASLPRSLSKRPSMRKSLLPEGWTLAGRAMFEQDSDREDDHIMALESEADEWIAMQAFLDDDLSTAQMGHEAATPSWEQYNDLGGLTEVR